ncbi:MAG: hypothetical protein WDO13_03045 [Verrucomicrobiota bacterium]
MTLDECRLGRAPHGARAARGNRPGGRAWPTSGSRTLAILVDPRPRRPRALHRLRAHHAARAQRRRRLAHAPELQRAAHPAHAPHLRLPVGLLQRPSSGSGTARRPASACSTCASSRSDGSPVSGVDVLLRNLSRPVDTLGPMGLLGLLMIFVTRKAQRLGDLMARTIVIHETAIDWSLFDPLRGRRRRARRATHRAGHPAQRRAVGAAAPLPQPPHATPARRAHAPGPVAPRNAAPRRPGHRPRALRAAGPRTGSWSWPSAPENSQNRKT